MPDSHDPASNSGIKAATFQAPDSAVKSGADSSSDNTSKASNTPISRSLVSRANGPWWHSQFNLMLCVFALLGVAALLFIVLTPAPNSSLKSTVVSAQGQTKVVESAVTASDAEDATAPWDESRRKQARSDSQDILAEVLKVKKQLETQNVKEWAEQGFNAALENANQGDEFYKRKDYVQAVRSYQAALSELQNLDALIPGVISGLVNAGDAAIVAGKTQLAREKFQAALNLDPNHIPALTGLDRADNLDQVLELMRAAKFDEQAFLGSDELAHLKLAADKYQQVLSLDPRTEQAKLASERVAQLTADKQFRDAMSGGFTALFAKRYASAKQGFAKALKIKPDDPTASAAYRQSLASDKRSSLSTLLSNGKSLERNEEWASALSTYEAVLQRDPNQVSAKLGKIRSQARKQLDQAITDVLADPLALSRSTARQSAESVLADARAINKKGALLTRQIAQMEASLKALDSTVKVSFTSDQLTEVSLVKAGANKIALGKFATKNLALKPGRYVVSGKRLGFKDVRQEIELRSKGGKIQSFAIKCTTPVGGSVASDVVSN